MASFVQQWRQSVRHIPSYAPLLSDHMMAITVHVQPYFYKVAHASLFDDLYIDIFRNTFNGFNK